MSICESLYRALGGRTLPVTLHSRFTSAANLTTPLGLVTLLESGKRLQPYAMVLREPMNFERLETGALRLCRGGLFQGGMQLVALGDAVVTDLKRKLGIAPVCAMAGAVRRFLAHAPGEGLSGLALGRVDEPFGTLVAPRLQVLREAVRCGDSEAAASAASRLAGCGSGLTPSSDDLLCGYLAVLPCHEPWAELTLQIAHAAAEKTGDISAALLTRAGEGFFSEDVLDLLDCLREGTENGALTQALLRVADFGSSSGYDFLTGVYFGILDGCGMGGVKH